MPIKFTSPTKRKVFLRCPKRFYFRYLHKPDDSRLVEHYRQQRLYGIRELGGHLIHRTVAGMVRAIAAGDRSWNDKVAGQKCQEAFDLIAAKSLAAEPGDWIGGTQLAETFNGATLAMIRDDISYWRQIIPIAVENAWRAANSLDLRAETSDYRIEAEREALWKKGGQTLRCIFDVLIQTPYRVICIDWKCHEIDQADVLQVRQYLEFLHYREKVPVSKLSGFAIDLIHEAIVEVRFDPYGLGRSGSRVAVTRLAPSAPAGPPTDPFPAKPHPDLCLRCPYAAVCQDAIGLPKKKSANNNPAYWKVLDNVVCQ